MTTTPPSDSSKPTSPQSPAVDESAPHTTDSIDTTPAADEAPATATHDHVTEDNATQDHATGGNATEDNAATTTQAAPATQDSGAPTPAATTSSPAEPTAEAAPTASESKVVYVSAPPPPAQKGARGVGALVAILSTGIFAAVYAGLVLAVSFIAPPVSAAATLQYFGAPIYWVPVIVFALSYLLLVVIVNRAGWWAHVLGGFLVAVLVYISFIGAALIMAGAVGGTASVVGGIVLAQLTNPLGFAAAVAAREVPIWVGGMVAKRGRTVAARNAEARAAYQRDLEAHRASVAGNTAV